MKLLRVKFFNLLAIITLIGLVSSCTEKDIVEPTILNKEVIEVEATSVLSQSYTERVSEEQAEELFGKMVDNYMDNLPESEVDLRGKSTEVYVVVQLTTGRQGNNGTYGNAKAKIRLRTDNYGMIGNLNLHKSKYPGADNYYLVRIPTNPICWAELDYIQISLQGNDDWFLEKVRVVARPDRQTKYSSGLSAIRAGNAYIPAYSKKAFYGKRNKLSFCY